MPRSPRRAAPGTRSRRPRTPGATSSCGIPSSRARLRSTASSSPTPARSCAPRPSARSRTSRACRSTRRRGLPAVLQNLKADAPIYPEFEVLRLSFGLERMREWLGPDDPVVRQRVRQRFAGSLANRLVRQSSLGDPAARMALYEGGQAAIDASQDPMITPRGRGGPRCAGAPQAVRGRGRRADAARPGGDREGALRRVRHEHLSGRDLHAAPLLRRA